MNNIIIIGFMGTGKTTVSNRLAKRLGSQVLDTDAQIVLAEGKSVSEIFEQNGEQYFRHCEQKLLSALLSEKSLILSCGGGMAMDNENVRLMKKLGTVFLLTASATTIFSRVKSSTKRPILNGNMNQDYIAKLYSTREKNYLSAADFIVSTDNKSIDTICSEIEDNVK